MTLEFTCIADLKCEVAESPVYDERSGLLYFVDILGRRAGVLAPGLKEPKFWSFESEVGSLGLAASGRLVVALRDSVILFDPATEQRQELCRIDADRPETRLNDGKVGPDGAFWVGSMDNGKSSPIGSLYRVQGSGQVERKVEGIIVSNGLTWTADGELMFHADSRGPWIERWRFDRWTGELSERMRFPVPDETTGRPDGGACDAKGFYWNAGVSAGRLNCFAPDGSLQESFDVPFPAPTMPCFGGPDFRTLFVTSLREGRSADELARAPQSGGIFAAASPVAGFAPWRFLDI